MRYRIGGLDYSGAYCNSKSAVFADEMSAHMCYCANNFALPCWSPVSSRLQRSAQPSHRSWTCLRWQSQILDSALRVSAANDIEHGVLRGNAASPASPFVLLGLPQFAGKTFGKGDPRLLQVRPWFFPADTHAKTSLKHRSQGQTPGQHSVLPAGSQTAPAASACRVVFVRPLRPVMPAASAETNK